LVSATLGLVTGWDVRGRENIPREGGLIIASNHTSYWDPPMVGASLPREVHFLAKEELFRSPVIGPLIASVNAIPIRRGTADLSGLSRAIDGLKRGGALLIFPEGSRMRDGELHPARPGVGLLSVQADVPVAACYISGSNRPGAWWRRGVRVRITFGLPRSWRELAGADADLPPGRTLYQRVGDGIMREIAGLRNEQRQSASRGAA
jgi:1-acyl-sn-glycerol-3-phosphate acyltransferase